jgi:hypothetical protein
MFQFPGFASYTYEFSARLPKVIRQSFLIQKSSDQRLFASFPRHIAGYHVFRRLSMPRHPPYTLSSLTTFIDHRRVFSREELTPRKATSGRAGQDADHIRRLHQTLLPDFIASCAAISITDQQSPKRCSTTSTRRKNSNIGVGITPLQGWCRGV